MGKQILPQDKFGNWTVLGKGRAAGKHRLVRVQCDCGTVREIQRASLINGRSKSCGCLFSEKISLVNTKHGMTNTSTYRSWQSMNKRCTNKNDPMYYLYGGSGVSVCDEWYSFEQFYADMGKRPKGCSLDRIDGSKGYSADNCRWATPREQALNRSTTKHDSISYNGKTQALTEWADELGVKASVLYARIVRMKWSVEKAFTQPVKRYRK
jgi:hypothetical protein